MSAREGAVVTWRGRVEVGQELRLASTGTSAQAIAANADSRGSRRTMQGSSLQSSSCILSLARYQTHAAGDRDRTSQFENQPLLIYRHAFQTLGHRYEDREGDVTDAVPPAVVFIKL